MNACPYRDETARLLLHVFCAIKVSFFFTILPILLTGILLRICKGGMVSVKAYYNETVETVRRDLNGEQYKDFLVLILIVSAVVSLFLGETESAAVILVVIVALLMSLPVPFAPVHLLFINLLTDSLPAIALGLEPYHHDVMGEKPRPVKESILTKDFLTRIGVEGGVIGAVVLAAFLIGYRDGNKVLAGTMAFAVLCLSRLLHGYNCKAKKPVIFTGEFFNNHFMQGAFLAGFVLLTVVLTVPALHGFFVVQTLKMGELLTVYGLSGLSMLVIQGLKQVVKF